MKKLILVFAATLMLLNVYAQTDSSRNRMSPPHIDNNSNHNVNNNNTKDDMNPKHDINNNANPNMRNNPNDVTPAQTIDKSNIEGDGVMMQNGKMMMVKNGKATMLGNDITMSNGTKVMSNETIIKRYGTKTMMKEGQHMDWSGNMVPMKDSKTKKEGDSKKGSKY